MLEIPSVASEWRKQKIKKIYQSIPYGRGDHLSNGLLAYAETQPSAVEKIAKYFTWRRHVFYDLGSGRGNVVIQAALTHRLKKTVGIELVKESHEDALKALKIAHSTKDLSNKEDVRFENKDFRNVNISDGDVIYIVATAFDEVTMKNIESKMTTLKKGSIVIIVDQEIKSDKFKKIGTDSYDLDSYDGVANIFEKI